MGEDLEHWNWVLSQRKEDLSLETIRAEDDELLKILKADIEEAENKIEELSLIIKTKEPSSCN